jgi:hypothetical protein
MNHSTSSRLLFLASLLASPAAAQTNYAPSAVPVNDCSGTITTGGASQTALPAGKAPHGYILSNLDTAEALWFNPTGAAAAVATAGSHPLAAGTAATFAGAGQFRTVEGMGTGSALNVTATTAAHKFSCAYW